MQSRMLFKNCGLSTRSPEHMFTILSMNFSRYILKSVASYISKGLEVELRLEFKKIVLRIISLNI